MQQFLSRYSAILVSTLVAAAGWLMAQAYAAHDQLTRIEDKIDQHTGTLQWQGRALKDLSKTVSDHLIADAARDGRR